MGTFKETPRAPYDHPRAVVWTLA